LEVKKVNKELKRLQKKLRIEYPPHHWKHIAVWAAFWRLVDALSS
jgi:hypothetical protein